MGEKVKIGRSFFPWTTSRLGGDPQRRSPARTVTRGRGRGGIPRAWRFKCALAYCARSAP